MFVETLPKFVLELNKPGTGNRPNLGRTRRKSAKRNHSSAKMSEAISNEPILMPNPHRFVLFPIRHHAVWEMYKKHEVRVQQPVVALITLTGLECMLIPFLLFRPAFGQLRRLIYLRI